MGFVPIVEVGSAVGNFIGHIDKLRFERRTQVEQIFGEFRKLRSRIIVRMFDDALANFEGEVEAAKGGVAQLEVFHNAQRVEVVVERISMFAHGQIEGFFSGMAEWGMAHVVDQSQGFNQIDVQAQLSGYGSRDLRDFNGVSQAIAKVIGVAPSEDLGFRFETAKSPGVDNAITVALKVVAIGMPRLVITASAGLFHPHRVVGEHGESLAEAFSIQHSVRRGPYWIRRPGLSAKC